VTAAKEDVLFTQKLVKEKETRALIAHQKSEAAQQVFRAEAENVVVAQQKLAKVSIQRWKFMRNDSTLNFRPKRLLQSFS
jgi:hypothetical protein